MSWTGPGGAAIETPRRESSPTEAMLEWRRTGSGQHRKAKHRAIVAWLLVRVLGMTMAEAARNEDVDERTISRRLDRVESMLETLRSTDHP